MFLSIYKQTFTAEDVKTKQATNAKISMFVSRVETIVYLFM